MAAGPLGAASRQAAGTLSATHARTASTASASAVSGPISIRPPAVSSGTTRCVTMTPSPSLEAWRALLLERREAFAKVFAARRQLHGERLVPQMVVEGAGGAGVQQPLGEAQRHGRPAGERAAQPLGF